ncbi:MAG TPA: DsbA family protein, partial [Gemmataceae bacterium]|nr:DsbA family protein [Gemmataceae bacterium]
MPPDPPAPAVYIDYYTDPLCSWSWALEPAWRRLRYEFGDRLAYRYRMAGMIPDWDHFADPMNAVHTPRQMAPHWFAVRQLSGMPLDERVWLEDPPASSFPACVAFEAAALQGPAAAERYLRRL